MKVSVIGMGSFGTTIAQLISNNAEDVMLFGRNIETINSINKGHHNNIYHPLIRLNSNIKAYSIFTDRKMIGEADLVAFCVPSGAVRDTARCLNPYLKNNIIISTAKGIEYPSLNFMTQIIREETANDNVFSLSGPTFSDEMIRKAISGITLGINNNKYKKDIFDALKATNLLIDCTKDVNGVELCGVLKNVYAVAMGIVDSYFYAYNEHYVFLNLCFKEMNHILINRGHHNILDKFCAFGDFNLTTNADKSRNRTLGLMIGKNISLNIAQSTVTFESSKSIKAIKHMSEIYDLDTPIINFVDSAFNAPEAVRNQIGLLIKAMNYDA